MSDNQGVTPEHLRNLGNLPANEASDGVSLRERIRGTFERHTMPEAGDPELTMFDTDAIIDDLANLIHQHDQRIVAEAERRAREETQNKILRLGTGNAEGLASVDYGEVSDGYHTFNELYDFRRVYNAALFNEWAAQGKYNVHKSWKHSDGELCFGGGWFIVVAQLPTGQISNHYELKDWDLFQIPEIEKAPEWDGHTPQDVAKRLKAFLAAQQDGQGEQPSAVDAEWIDQQIERSEES